MAKLETLVASYCAFTSSSKHDNVPHIYEDELLKFQMDILVVTKLCFLQVKDMYWQACLVVLIVAVINPSTIGHFVWESIPSLRSLMEVLITGDILARLNIPSWSCLVLG